MELNCLMEALSADQSSTNKENPRAALYKSKESKSSQEVRRKKFLESQKSKRYDFVNHARQLATGEFVKSETVDAKNLEYEDMEFDCAPVRCMRPQKDQLMLSEWMVEIPDDLETDYFLVLCPVAKRTLIIASKGRTKAYSRSGYLVDNFRSLLPGGNPQGCSGYTILDCFYCPDQKTYFVLDMMCWKSHPFYDSETEFRFYWSATKFKESPEVTEVSANNPFKFVPLPYYASDENTIKTVVWSPLPFPDGVKLDGLLFFHKRAHYIPRQTPLAVWLKGFMVPEILNIPVPEAYMADKPQDYTNMKEYIPRAFEKRKKYREIILDAMDSAAALLP